MSTSSLRLRAFRPEEAVILLERLRGWMPEAIRLQGRTHVENTPMIRLFERFGFVCEGIMRSYWPLAGRSGDMGLWALTRADYEALAPPESR